jgi:hypothetical protein
MKILGEVRLGRILELLIGEHQMILKDKDLMMFIIPQ